MSKEVTSVKELINSIAENRTQTSANSKDEVRVAAAMLNDPNYVVDVYNKTGVIGQYSPYADTRNMVSDIIRNTAKINDEEARKLAENFQFTKNNAQTMVNFSKEYINTYLQTGRKLPLGCREKSNVSLIRKVKEAKVNSFPIPIKTNVDGSKEYNTSNKVTPAYETIKVSGTCPAHLKNAEKAKEESK